WSLVIGRWSLVVGRWSLVIGRWSLVVWSLVIRRGEPYGTVCAIRARMLITSLEDLQVYQQALEAADAISAILDRPRLKRDPELRQQLADCSARVPALISEGFGQGTDRHCAHFQRIARGSCNELRTHLRVCLGRGYIDDQECARLSDRYVIIGKRLTRWIQELMKANRRNRG
ncbi:MAG TPA: four helix bundle protein, partial [Vicinamibacterales bacterium]|nr:four helix bundle protein [Vicinamibacterales bacterium]